MPPPTILDYAKLAQDVYLAKSSPQIALKGWTPVDEVSTPQGLMARAYRAEDGRVVVAFAGTNDTQGDLRADFNFTRLFNERPKPGELARLPLGTVAAEGPRSAIDAALDGRGAGELPGGIAPQFREALAFVKRVRDAHPDSVIQVTGQSLGGGHAQLAAKVFRLDAVTFDAPGAALLAANPAYAKMASEFSPKYAINPDAFRPGKVVNYVIDGTIIADPKFTGPQVGGTQADRLQAPALLSIQPGLAAGLRDAIKQAGLSIILNGRGATVLPYFEEAVLGPHHMHNIVDTLQVRQTNLGQTQVDLKLNPEKALGLGR